MVAHQRHVGICRELDCARCRFAKGHYKHYGSWLRDSKSCGVWRTKCKFCKVTVTPKPWNLSRHESGAAHQRAIRRLLPAPPREDFKEVLTAVKDCRAAGEDGLPGIGSGIKVRRLVLCLADAIKVRHHKWIRQRKPSSFTLSRDVRKGRVCILWSATTKRLKNRTGLPAWLPVERSAARDMLSLTRVGITRFPTVHLGSTRRCFKTSIRKTIRKRTHGMTSSLSVALPARLWPLPTQRPSSTFHGNGSSSPQFIRGPLGR